MFQECIIVGNLGADPEMRYMPDGRPVTNFNVAVNRVWTDEQGQRQERTTWFRVAVWGRQAEICNQYLKKGRQVLVSGEVEARAFLGQDGQPRASLELRATRVRFLGGREEVAPPSELGAGPLPPHDEEEIPF